jgi:hypothetical protein
MDQREEDEIRGQFLDGAVRMGRSDSFGHEVGSQYVDLFWTPVLGPSVLALMRWARWRLPERESILVPTTEICEALGRMAPGKACAIVKRAISFHAADFVERGPGSVVVVRGALPWLSEPRVEQLSPGLRTAHEALAGAR